MGAASEQPELWSDAGAADHPLDLYHAHRLAEGGVERFADIGPDAVARFRADGFLVIRHGFSAAAVAEARAGVVDLVAGAVPEFRGIQFEARAHALLSSLAPEDRQDHVRKLWLFCAHEPRLRALAEDPAMLGAIAALMGASPEMFQDQALLKPPLGGREKPWHQDNAYFNVPAQTPVVGAWIAIDAATVENGCMHVIPGSHLEGPVVHFSRRDWQICDAQVATERDVAVPLPPGGCLLFHGLLHHGTPANRSAKRRRALQFHYRPAATPAVSARERMAVFGSEGKDATC